MNKLFKQEDIELLFNELCQRFPYGVKGIRKYKRKSPYCEIDILKKRDIEALETLVKCGTAVVTTGGFFDELKDYVFQPYLRPLSSMTETEKAELKKMTCPDGTGTFDEKGLIVPATHIGDNIGYSFMSDIIIWLLRHHFDIHGLIEKGLAVEAKEWVYDQKEQ